MEQKQAVILFSGGLDSTTLLAIARNQGFELNTLTFNYGQRHVVESQAAERIAKAYRVKRTLVFPMDFQLIGGSSLVDSSMEIPHDRSDIEISTGIPDTYVPARNMIFLSIAAGWAEVIGADDIFIGVNAIDYSGYPDCRPEFINAFQKMVNLGTAAGSDRGRTLKIHTPLMKLSKGEIISEGVALGVDYSMTHSCYDPNADGLACGFCDSCLLRKKGFAEAGVADPTRYIN